MAKKSVAPSAVSTAPRPKPTISFDLPDGLPDNLPSVKKSVRLIVTGTLVEVEAKNSDYNEYDRIRVRPDSVKVEDGKKK